MKPLRTHALGRIAQNPLGKLNPNLGDGVRSVTNTSTSMTFALANSANPTPTGQNFTYTTAIANVGALTATTLSLVITLAASLTYVSATGLGWSFDVVGQVVTCTRVEEPVGVSPVVTITVTAGVLAASITTTGVLTAANAYTVSDSKTTSVVVVP